MTENSWVQLERELSATPEQVWSYWTDPAMFQSWYGPMGMSIPVAEMDLRPGGSRKICMEMRTPDRDMTMWFSGVYKEISAPYRLIYTESMSDPEGNVLSPEQMGMPAGQPMITEVVVELSAADDGKTKLTLTHVGVPHESPGAMGWAQAIDKLVAKFEA